MSFLVTQVSAEQFRRAAVIKEQIDKLQNELSHLLGSDQLPRSSQVFARNGKKARRRMSAVARKKIAAAARLRWKKAKAAGKTRL